MQTSTGQNAAPVANIFENLPVNMPDELTTVLVSSQQVRIERIVSHGHASPGDFWYDQPQGEFVVLLKGAARLRFEGEISARDLKPGDYAWIPARCRHRVDW